MNKLLVITLLLATTTISAKEFITIVPVEKTAFSVSEMKLELVSVLETGMNENYEQMKLELAVNLKKMQIATSKRKTYKIELIEAE